MPGLLWQFPGVFSLCMVDPSTVWNYWLLFPRLWSAHPVSWAHCHPGFIDSSLRLGWHSNLIMENFSKISWNRKLLSMEKWTHELLCTAVFVMEHVLHRTDSFNQRQVVLPWMSLGIILNLLYIYFYVYVNHVVAGAYGDQKRKVSEPLELELQGFVSCLIWVLGR